MCMVERRAYRTPLIEHVGTVLCDIMVWIITAQPIFLSHFVRSPMAGERI